MRASRFLHLGLEQVASSLGQFGAQCLLVISETCPVTVIEFFDHLKRPAPLDDVPSHHVTIEAVRQFDMTSGAQQIDRIAELLVGVPDQLMERIQVPTSTLHGLQRFGYLAEGDDGVVGDIGGLAMVRCRGFSLLVFRHVGLNPVSAGGW